MKSSTGYILICMILLTALLGLIILLITVTEQPSLIFDESLKESSLNSQDNASTIHPIESSKDDHFKEKEDLKEQSVHELNDFSVHNLDSNLTRLEIASETNSSSVDISSPDSNPTQTIFITKYSEISAPFAGKYMDILSYGNESFYLTKDNGEIELWVYKSEDGSMERLRVIQTEIRIQRAKIFDKFNILVVEAVSDGSEKFSRLWFVNRDNGSRLELANATHEIVDVATKEGVVSFCFIQQI